MPVTVKPLSIFIRLSLRAAVVLFRLIILTIRMRVTPRARVFLDSAPASSMFLVWHNRGTLALAGFARYGKHVPLTGLVSASGDGSLIAEVMQALGMPCARGSSSKRAVEATRQLMSVLASGRNVVLTPDGPRGPVYIIKEGTVDFSRHAKAVYLLGFHCNRVWRFNSWDKYMIPKPFSKLTFDVEQVEITPGVTAAMLIDKMNELNRNLEAISPSL